MLVSISSWSTADITNESSYGKNVRHNTSKTVTHVPQTCHSSCNIHNAISCTLTWLRLTGQAARSYRSTSRTGKILNYVLHLKFVIAVAVKEPKAVLHLKYMTEVQMVLNTTMTFPMTSEGISPNATPNLKYRLCYRNVRVRLNTVLGF
jgi:hypothetical protein